MDERFLKQYYRAGLEANPDQIYWSNNANQPSPDTSWLKAGIGIGGAVGAGFIPLGNGTRVWDWYLKGIRAFEEYFPGQIPRTLQTSNIFSQFEAPSRATRIITPRQMARPVAEGGWSLGQLEYISKRTGISEGRIRTEGLLFKEGKLYLQRSNQEILASASIIRNINQSPHFSTSAARSAGMDLPFHTKLFQQELAFTNAAGQEVKEAFQILGGSSKWQNAKHQLFAVGTEAIERANRLAHQLYDAPILGKALKKLPFNIYVKSAGGLETFARFAGKLGVGGGLAYLGYKQLDYMTRNASILDSTVFDKGITAGAATIWAKANLGLAKIGDMTGATERAREQEKYAPGSTDLTKLLAFPAMGAFAGLGLHYLQRTSLMAKLQLGGMDVLTASAQASKQLSEYGPKGPMNAIGRALRESSSTVLRSIAKSRTRLLATTGAVIGAIPILPFLFNALAPEYTESELADIYSGKTELAVRKGAGWELGSTPWEGTNIMYYRPSWVARANMDPTDVGVWGALEKERGGELSPLSRWYTKNFTYDLEQSHYQDRPYPITGKAFFDVPIIGPLLTGTIGQIIKPSRYMHQDEYNSDGSFKYLSPGFDISRATELGEELPGAPISPQGLKGITGESAYRAAELIGLPGYLLQVTKKSITGSETPFENDIQLQSADEMASIQRSYWDENVGGGFGTTELLRRLIPHKRTQVETYNNIRNTMPNWLPGPGERGPNLQYGDPFAQIPLGELRLPGEAYAKRYPELEGIAPEDYPLAHKYKILADVAPYTDKFDEMGMRAGEAHKFKQFNEKEEAIYQQVKEQVLAKRKRKTFFDYKYRDKKVSPVTEALTAWNESQKGEAGPSWFERTLGSYWETLAHNADSPFEQITPVSPAAKLLHMRTATEDYEKSRVFGDEAAFWDRPWSDFIRPFLTETVHSLGNKDMPDHIQRQRKVDEYFDMLKYVKTTRLRDIAISAWDYEAAAEYEQKSRETLFGINPYTYNYSDIFRALPRRDRDYFNAFAATEDQEERQKILNLVPENEQGLFVAKWQQQDGQDFLRAKKLGLLTEQQIEEGQAQLDQLVDEKSTQGFPASKDLFQEYLATKQPKESYPDWYRRTKLVAQKAEELGINIPGPDWVGWHSHVDLDDIKLKVVQNLGESIQDYDLWPNREKAMRLKEEYLGDEAIAPLLQRPDPVTIKRNIELLLEQHDIRDPDVQVYLMKGARHQASLDISEDRSEDIEDILDN